MPRAVHNLICIARYTFHNLICIARNALHNVVKRTQIRSRQETHQRKRGTQAVASRNRANEVDCCRDLDDVVETGSPKKAPAVVD
jgi:hypothetical protein